MSARYAKLRLRISIQYLADMPHLDRLDREEKKSAIRDSLQHLPVTPIAQTDVWALYEHQYAFKLN